MVVSSNHVVSMGLLDLPTETLERVFLLLHYFDLCNVKLVRKSEWSWYPSGEGNTPFLRLVDSSLIDKVLNFLNVLHQASRRSLEVIRGSASLSYLKELFLSPYQDDAFTLGGEFTGHVPIADRCARLRAHRLRWNKLEWVSSTTIDLPVRGSEPDSVLRRNVICFPSGPTCLCFVQLPSEVNNESRTREWHVTLKLGPRSVFRFYGDHMDFDPAGDVFIFLDNGQAMQVDRR